MYTLTIDHNPKAPEIRRKKKVVIRLQQLSLRRIKIYDWLDKNENEQGCHELIFFLCLQYLKIFQYIANDNSSVAIWCEYFAMDQLTSVELKYTFLLKDIREYFFCPC